MSRRTIAALCAAVGLGLVIAVTMSATASAKPKGVAGLAQRTVQAHITAPAHNTSEVQAWYDPDELLTGGGYTIFSVGHDDKVYVNAPYQDRSWLVEFVNDTDFNIELYAFTVCIGAAK